MRVREVMTAEVWTARVGDALRDVERGLLARRFTSVPIVDEERRLVGLVSRTDILKASPRTRRSGVVSDVMTWPVATAGPDDDARDVAERMVHTGFRHLPVVHDGRLVGIISHADIVRSIVAVDDAKLCVRARTAVAAYLAYSFGHDVTVRSAGGIVSLEGRVRTMHEARTLAGIVECLDGVAAVDNRLEADERMPDASMFIG